MNARHGVIAICAVVALAGAGVALAQEDNVLQRYDLALENLQFAIDSVPGDGVQARDELERALNALLTLSRDATSVNLVQAMEQTFARARTAVENQSRTDLAVQAAVLRGGFRRLVMDSALTADAAGEPEVARGRLLHLAADMGFSQAALDELTAAQGGDAMRLAFEAGVADAIATELTVANRLLESDRDAAYVSVATAYGDSLLIQDSPRADTGLNQALLSAAQALVNGDDEAVAEATQTASAQLSRLAAAARAGEAGAPRAAGEVPADAASADDDPAAAAGPAAVEGEAAGQGEPAGQDAAAATAATDDAAPGVVGDLPAVADRPLDQPDSNAAPSAAGQAAAGLPLSSEDQTDPSQPAEGAAGAAGASTSAIATLDDEQAMALAAATLQQQARDAAATELSAELRAAGLSQNQANSLAESLLGAGFSSTVEAVDGLGAAVASAIASLRTGETAAARAEVKAVADAYSGPLAELVAAHDPVVADDTATLLASLQQRPSLRAHDLSLLAAQVDAVERAVANEPQAAGHALELAVDSYWSGWTRLIVLVVLGVLAFVPLRYLNLAFGGGNANWRLVAWALFLLLVPLVYEAVAALGSILAALLDMPALNALTSWSMFTSTTGQVAWAALVFIALLLATIGLRGICRQFGLLGGANQVAVGTAGANPTMVDMTRTTKPSAVDWDEEF
ncbi:MAG TPA: hypothetical protein VFD39_04330 [Trueperaceae bacterium]|nr:hypothetical protein [Trueperaceae bacterium]